MRLLPTQRETTHSREGQPRCAGHDEHIAGAERHRQLLPPGHLEHVAERQQVGLLALKDDILAPLDVLSTRLEDYLVEVPGMLQRLPRDRHVASVGRDDQQV